MREILFKAKRLDNGKWVQGNLLIGPQGITLIWPIGEILSYAEQVDPKTVCEYSGRADKNGVKIFEGDIAKPPAWISFDGREAVCKFVNWDNTVAPVAGLAFLFPSESEGDIEGRIIDTDEWDEFEVIGNIYDKERTEE